MITCRFFSATGQNPLLEAVTAVYLQPLVGKRTADRSRRGFEDSHILTSGCDVLFDLTRILFLIDPIVSENIEISHAVSS